MLILLNSNCIVGDFDIFPNRYPNRVLVTVLTNRDKQLGVFYNDLYGEKRAQAVKVKMLRDWSDYQTFKIEKFSAVDNIFTVMSPNKMFKFLLTKIYDSWSDLSNKKVNESKWNLKTLDNKIDLTFTYNY